MCYLFKNITLLLQKLTTLNLFFNNQLHRVLLIFHSNLILSMGVIWEWQPKSK